MTRLVLGYRFPYFSGSSLGWIPFALVKGLSFGQDCPDGTRHFVGQRSNHYIEMPALQQPLDPATVSAPAGNGSGSADQQGSQVGVSPLGNTELLCFSARANLSWS